MTIRVLVADEREASFFDVDKLNGPLRLSSSLEDPTARLRDRDLETDRPGRGFGVEGGRHAVDGERSTRRENESRFARRIADEIERGRHRREFDRIVIMAGPRMLGLLREALPDSARTAVAAEIPKDLAHHDIAAISEHVPREAFYRLG